MAEATVEKKEVVREITSHAIDNPFPQNTTITTNISSGRGANDKYEVHVRVPIAKGKKYEAEDKMAQDFFGCSFEEIVKNGARQLSTRPAFDTIFVDGKLPAGGHKKLQDLMTEYKVGRVSGGPTQKKRAEIGGKVMGIADQLGMTEEELLKKLSTMK